MEKTIVTGFLVIVAVIGSVMLFNSVYPAIVQSTNSMVQMKSRLDDRMVNDIEIVHSSGELDSTATWQDVNGDGRFNVFIWSKNVGSRRISAVDRMDVFFGQEGDFSRIPHESNAGGSFPYWNYSVENDATWNPTATLKITIHFSATQPTGRYYIKLIAPSGVEDSTFMAM